jgi:MFS family permease
MSSPSPPRLSLAGSEPLPTPLTTEAAPTLLTPAFVRLLTIQFCFGLSFSVYFLLPKYLTTELHAGAATIGAVGSAALWSGVLATPLIARVLDRVGRRPALLGGAAIAFFTSLAMPAVDSVGPLLFGIRIVQGVGFALVFNAASAATADLAAHGRLGMAIGLLGTASLLSNAIAPAAAELVADSFGWTPVFLAAAATSLVAFVISLSTRDTPRDSAASSTPIATEGSWRVTYAALVNGAAFGTVFTFTQPHALDLGALRVSGFFVGYTVAAMAVRLLFGNAADRLGREVVARYSFAFYGVVCCSIAYLVPGFLELFGFAFGIGHGLLYPSLVTLAAERSDPARRGAMLTLFNGAFNFGAGLTLLGGGFVAHATSYPALFLFVGVWVLVSVPSLPKTLPRSR